MALERGECHVVAQYFLVRLRVRFHDKSPASTVLSPLLLFVVLPQLVFNIAIAVEHVRWSFSSPHPAAFIALRTYSVRNAKFVYRYLC
jgi:hypothetical protein